MAVADNLKQTSFISSQQVNHHIIINRPAASAGLQARSFLQNTIIFIIIDIPIQLYFRYTAMLYYCITIF